MTARWMVPKWGPRCKAHLYSEQRPPLDHYMKIACELRADNIGSLRPDDGRPRCKRCLAAEKRAGKGGGR